MTAGRIIGIVLILLGMVILGRDAMSSLSSGEVDLVPLGGLWFELHPSSLNGLQAGTERYLAVWLWDSVIEPMLHWPAFLFPLVPGLLLAVFCRRRREGQQGKRFFKRRT